MSDSLCERCEKRPAVKGEEYCQDCLDNMAEAAWDRQMDDGETFRGGEAEDFYREQQEKARRLK